MPLLCAITPVAQQLFSWRITVGQAQRKEKAGEAKLTISIKLLRVVTPNIRTRFNHYIVYMGGEGGVAVWLRA